MTIDVRPLEPDHWDRWYDTFLGAFGGGDEPEESRRLDHDLVETERALAAWDGDDIVGSAGTFSFRTVVPGGALVPAAGLTLVGVSATHRRRGVLTAMMRRQLDDVRAAGESLALLTASEPGIYGRFGYGAATRQLIARIDTGRVRLTVPPGADEVALRYADPAEALAACEEVYARVVAGGRPGMLARAPHWERRPLLDEARSPGSGSKLRCVLATRDGRTVGYARFRTTPQWGPYATPDGTVELRDLEALDPAAYGALWRFLFGIDLMSTVAVGNAPLDDAWQHMVSDIRRCAVTVRDSLYVRLVDVGAALAARTYRTPVDVVLDVTDGFCPWNEGRWRLVGDAKGASCERTTDAADLALSARELGAAYLGDVSLTALAAAGRVRELREGAAAAASAGFGSDVAPWLPHGF
ncbi:GNAT family N-acetyltransferase [Streptomyces sp. NPDC060194]|uniref:GNAT family N-acetyltransferase n=1 Tax=Streptomyces sp. NPDC060194 TaxID=3347069 RepID=UPI003652593E